MSWRVNKDEALEHVISGLVAGGIWRGAWRDALGQRKDGYLAASWHPYKRVGRFADVKAAKAAVEKEIT